jgi:hypothetical protein
MTKNSLADLENIIETNRCKFHQVGKALRRIRDGRLYRELLFDSFETYVRDRWDMARSQAYRLMDASKVIDNLSPIGDGVLPQNESQARPLARLKTIHQRNIWREFIESGTALNASNIRKFVNMRLKKAAPESKPESRADIIAADFKTAVMAMLEQIRLAQNDHWQKTSRQAALFWLRVMKEKIKSNA